MVRTVVLAGAMLMVAASAALAVALTGNDYRYLRDEQGVAPDSETIRDMSADEQARLHDFIVEPSLKIYPATRDRNVADFLFEVHMRECSVWAHSHTGSQCPPTADATAEPGKEIADRQCNTCHLFGTSVAPAFFKLARQRKITDQEFAAALDHGHAMSPITLQPAEIKQLLTYIRSLM